MLTMAHSAVWKKLRLDSRSVMCIRVPGSPEGEEGFYIYDA